jgi:DNA processing protein
MKNTRDTTMVEEDVYKIALSLIPGIGGIIARKILAFTGSAKAVFTIPKESLLNIPGVGMLLADRITNKDILKKAEQELDFLNRKGIECLFYGEDGYPERLLDCYDAPLLLYLQGNVDLNGKHIISIVGTRRPGSYGLDICSRLVRDLAFEIPKLIVVSGLAYGIDHCAHKSALGNGLDTIAVLGHGFKYMYPALHREMARRISGQGALVTDFGSDHKPEKNNFIRRNRIIAGLADATIVVQSGHKGGALITADIANSYHRDVFTFPGRVGDPASAGCNQLIKIHKASLVEGARDVLINLGWISEPKTETMTQTEPFHELSEMESKIMDVLRTEGNVTIDEICLRCNMPVNRISEHLLMMEFAGLIKCLPGDVYGTES